ADFQVASTGTPSQFGRVTIQVQVNPQGAAYVEIVETTPWTHVGDLFGGLIGLDTSTGTGVVTSIVGGYIIVGDVGSIVKNAVRNAGWSDKEPNNFELAMAAAGLLGTFSGPGDGIVSAIRVIIQRIGNSPLADVLWCIAKRIITEGKMPTAAEEAFITMMKNDEIFSQAAKGVLTDDELFSQAARGLDKLGDPFASAVKNAATSPTLGIQTSQKIIDTVANLSDEVLDGLKNSGKIDDALAGITKLVDASLVDPAILTKTLGATAAFSGAYKQADLLADAKKVLDSTPNASGFDRLFKELRDAQNYESAKGYLYELIAARRLTDSGEAVLDVSTKGLIATDLRSSTHLIQVKFSADTLFAFVQKKGRGGFVEGKRKAEELGLGYKIVISEGLVEAGLLKWLSARGISIQTLPFP
ncbi:MAG: hypothetical protein KGQ60_16510, partial [Planctomycetes bacterium]|nr:hypothetical protein [Planctomycetota bacterium]